MNPESHEISFDTLERWFEFPTIDENGMPTSDAAYDLIQYLFANHNKSHSPESLAEELMLHPALIICICRHLLAHKLVKEDPSGADEYRYDINSSRASLQEKLEVSLVEYPDQSNKPALPPS